MRDFRRDELRQGRVHLHHRDGHRRRLAIVLRILERGAMVDDATK
jgi:hypothetical protein